MRKAVAQYEQKTKPKSHVDVRNCSWTGVQEAIQVATLEEGSDDESNIAKRSCSKMARNIPDFENWLSLLPNGDYGAVVCGVFKMVVVVGNHPLFRSSKLMVPGCEARERCSDSDL